MCVYKPTWKKPFLLFNTPFCTLVSLFLHNPEVFYFLHLSSHELIGSGFQQLRPLYICPHRACLSGWGGLAPQWNPSAFPFDFLLFLSSSFTCFRKLMWLLGCLICSICTLILFARILLFTCLFTAMPTACWVTL